MFLHLCNICVKKHLAQPAYLLPFLVPSPVINGTKSTSATPHRRTTTFSENTAPRACRIIKKYTPSGKWATDIDGIH